MPAPKEQGRNPISKGVKYSKKARSWCYYEHFNQTNVIDKQEWFNTEADALNRLRCTP